MTRPAAPRPAAPRPAALAAHQAGVAALQAGDCARAAAHFTEATRLDDRIAGFFANLGMALHGLGQVAAAENAYRRALGLDARLVTARNSLGTALQDQGRLEEAEAAFRATLALAPDYHEARVNLAATLHAQRRWDAAVSLLRAALALVPADAPALVNLAAALKDLGRAAQAEPWLRRALRLEPGEPQALINLALVRDKQGDAADSEALLRQVLAVAPDLPLPSWNLALLLLRQGRLSEGLPLYEARFAARPDPRFAFPPLPRWRGESLAGRTLLTWREQGLGDSLMFGALLLRLAARVRRDGGRLRVAVDPRLVGLFARALPDAAVIAAPLGPSLTADGADVHCPMGTLPLLLAPRLADFADLAGDDGATDEGWLIADPARLETWRDRLAALGPGLKIGLAWRSAVTDGERADAHLQLTDLAPLAGVGGVCFINLQYDLTAEEAADAAARLGAPLHVWPGVDLRHDLESAAALTASLDLVIATASSAGEMAAALGVPVWRLGGSDWTMLGTGARPWFPALRVWAPRPGEGLPQVVGRMARELARLRAASASAKVAPVAGAAADPLPDGLTRLAGRLAAAGQADRAGRAWWAMILHDPGAAAAFAGLANLRAGQGRHAHALRGWDRAVILEPACPGWLHNRANSLRALGRSAEADADWRAAAALAPGFALAEFNRGYAALERGEVAAGWDGLEQRFAAGQARPNRRFTVPRWRGGPLNGGDLLIWREQGIGDELMFAACYADGIRAAQAAGAGRVWIDAEPRLAGLLGRTFAAETVNAETVTVRPWTEGDPPPPGLAAQIPAGSLPALLRRSLTAFPADPPRLIADPALRARWRDRLATLGPGLKLGISWRSGLSGPERANSLTRLEDWRPLLTLPGVIPVNLQYDDCAAELTAAERLFGVTIHRWADLDLRGDLEGVAALVAGLDLVVSVGTSVAEMAGALGVPVWRLCRPDDWSALGCDARPWFPTMRLVYPLHRGAALADAVAVAARRLIEMRPPPAAAVSPLPPPPPPQGKPADLLARGMALHRAGRLEEAAAHYAAVPRGQPPYADARHLWGMIDCAAGRYEAALARFDEAIAVERRAADYHANRAVALNGLRRHADAADAARRALALRRDHGEAQVTLAAARAAWADLRLRAGDVVGAARHYRSLLALQPGNPTGWEGLARAQAGLTGPAALAAPVCWTRALRLAPDWSGAWGQLGAARRIAGDNGAAAAAFAMALTLEPGQAGALSNLALTRQDHATVADRWFARALAVDPGDGLARFNRGVMRLGAGADPDGWADYDGRLTVAALFPRPRLPYPLWAGEPLAGRHVLVWREQGLGDELMFAGLYPELLRRAGRVSIACGSRLVGLMARSFPDAAVRSAADCVARPDDSVDYQVAAGSLPRYLTRGLAAFPAASGWLRPDPARLAAFDARLAALGPGLRLGIAWTSRKQDAGRARAYLPLTDWRPLLTLPGVRPVSLQYDGRHDEIVAAGRDLGVPVAAFPDVDLMNDLEAAAALTAACDLVVSVASSVGEMAAALGVPAWRLGGRDWTWLGTGARPWHPAMRVMAPRPGENLAAVVAAAARRLRCLAPDAIGGDVSHEP